MPQGLVVAPLCSLKLSQAVFLAESNEIASPTSGSSRCLPSICSLPKRRPTILHSTWTGSGAVLYQRGLPLLRFCSEVVWKTLLQPLQECLAALQWIALDSLLHLDGLVLKEQKGNHL